MTQATDFFRRIYPMYIMISAFPIRREKREDTRNDNNDRAYIVYVAVLVHEYSGSGVAEAVGVRMSTVNPAKSA